MVSLVLPSLAKECEGHLEKHTQGSQLNSALHTAMNTHIANLRMLALPPDQLQAQLPPAQPPKSELFCWFVLVWSIVSNISAAGLVLFVNFRLPTILNALAFNVVTGPRLLRVTQYSLVFPPPPPIQ